MNDEDLRLQPVDDLAGRKALQLRPHRRRQITQQLFGAIGIAVVEDVVGRPSLWGAQTPVARVRSPVEELAGHDVHGVRVRLPRLDAPVVSHATGPHRHQRVEGVEEAAEADHVVHPLGDARVGRRQQRQRTAHAHPNVADPAGVDVRLLLQILEDADEGVHLLRLDELRVQASGEGHHHHHPGAGGVLPQLHQPRVIQVQRRCPHGEDNGSVTVIVRRPVDVGEDAAAGTIIDRDPFDDRVGGEPGDRPHRQVRHHVGQHQGGDDGGPPMLGEDEAGADERNEHEGGDQWPGAAQQREPEPRPSGGRRYQGVGVAHDLSVPSGCAGGNRRGR